MLTVIRLAGHASQEYSIYHSIKAVGYPGERHKPWGRSNSPPFPAGSFEEQADQHESNSSHFSESSTLEASSRGLLLPLKEEILSLPRDQKALHIAPDLLNKLRASRRGGARWEFRPLDTSSLSCYIETSTSPVLRKDVG